MRDGKRFSVDMDAVAAALTDKARLRPQPSPSNPLGWVATQAEQQALLDFCRRHGLWLLADEVYERLYYQGEVAPSILRLCAAVDAVIVVQSFSKTYCMTGWQLGWLVSQRPGAQGHAVERVHRLAPTMIQRAGIVALEQGEDDVNAMAELAGGTHVVLLRQLRRRARCRCPSRLEPSTSSHASKGEALVRLRCAASEGDEGVRSARRSRLRR